MSKLIVSQDNDVIVLLDGTRIEVNTSMDGTPCGWIITEAAQQTFAPDVCHGTADGRHLFQNDSNGRYCFACGTRR